MTLTDQIKEFTANAYQRLPPDYIPTFRNLIERLVKEEFGKIAPKAGALFPDFVLEDEQAKPVRASEHWKDRNLVLKFYRGGWCPYCNLELAALEKIVPQLAAENVELFAIAPEKPSFQRETRKSASADFRFLWDENNALARQLGIAFPVDTAVKDVYLKLNLDLDAVNGEWVLPVPATFVVDSGVVRYSFLDVDYMKRQDPIELLAVISSLNAQKGFKRNSLEIA